MSQETPEEQPVDVSEDQIAPSPPSEGASDAADPSLSGNLSASGLNAGAPEFVPRAPTSSNAMNRTEPRMVQGAPVIHVSHSPPGPAFHHAPVAQNHGQLESFGGGGAGYGEQEVVHGSPVDAEAAAASASAPAPEDCLSEEVTHKVTKQVEYYFSDANLATTEHLMRFISKDPEGFVPVSVIGAFKKIRALVNSNVQLATALRTSSKLVVSDDGKKVRRHQPFTDADLEELQARIVVAENLPEDHCYQNLVKIFSVVGSVKAIRTCYPQASIGMVHTASRPGKMDMFLAHKLHAFVEYETIEEAEKAVTELNDERNWRSGLRVRLLTRCMTKHGQGRGRKVGHEGEWAGDEKDVSTSYQPHEKHPEDPSQPIEVYQEQHMGEDCQNDKEGGGGGRRGRGRGRGGSGRGRGQYHHNNNYRSGGQAVGTPPSSHQIPTEQPGVNRQPPGPRMPDGTRGFTMGRGKPVDDIIGAVSS